MRQLLFIVGSGQFVCIPISHRRYALKLILLTRKTTP